jgi:hypothetical protein
MAPLALRAADLMPLMAAPGTVLMKDDFSESGALNRPHSGTQRTVEDSVLRGHLSTPGQQPKKRAMAKAE